MKVVLLCNDIDNIILSRKEAQDFVNNITEREYYNREIHDTLISLLKTDSEQIVLDAQCFTDKKFRSHPTLLYIIDKYKDEHYKIVEIPCNYFNITKKRGTEIVSYPDMSEWTECYIQDPAW